MTQNDLLALGFTIEILPSNRINISHPDRFKVNNILCTSAIRGKWLRTLEQKSIDSACQYIERIEFVS